MTDEIKEQETIDVPTAEAKDKIDLANAAAERIEAANAKLEANLNKLESIKVKQTFAGKAEAGKPQEKKDPAGDMARELLKESGYDDIDLPE